MALWQSMRVKIVGFQWSGQRRLYAVNRFRYRQREEMTRKTYIDGEKRNRLRWIDIEFMIGATFRYDQVNANASYILSNASSHPSAPVAGYAEIYNRILSSNDVLFYPLVDLGDGTVDLTTNYAIELVENNAQIQANRAGFITSIPTLNFCLRQPLTQYPSWANF